MLIKLSRSFAILLAFGLTGGAAFAEELNSPYRFDGGYLGAQAGYATAGSDLAIAGMPIFKSNFNGGIIGVYGGYGWQRGRRYLGVEVSAGYSGVKDGNLLPVGAEWISGEVERIYGFAILGKAGRVVGEEKKTLVYGLLGPSAVQVDARATLACCGGVSDGVLYPGISVGVGVEHFFNDKFSSRVQAVYTRYYDVGSLIEAVSDEKYKSHSAAIQFGVTRWFGR